MTIDSTFEITITEGISRDELKQKVADLLAADEILRERTVKKKLKQFDLRPMVYDLAVADSGSGEEGEPIMLIARLALEPSKTGRVDQVMLQLGLDPLDAKVHRKHVSLIEE